MTTLKELCDLAGNCLKLTVDVRYQDGHLYKEYIIGEGQNEDNATVHMKSDMMKGTLEMIDISCVHQVGTCRRWTWRM